MGVIRLAGKNFLSKVIEASDSPTNSGLLLRPLLEQRCFLKQSNFEVPIPVGLSNRTCQKYNNNYLQAQIKKEGFSRVVELKPSFYLLPERSSQPLRPPFVRKFPLRQVPV